jgi:hypothetical protein
MTRREKYCTGYVSEEYLRTGIPSHTREVLNDAEELRAILIENQKNTDLCKVRGYKKKRSIEERLIFV